MGSTSNIRHTSIGAHSPLGFAAGDTNLYRMEGNNSVNILDPSGLIGIMFDGSGYRASDGTIISSLISPYGDGETQIDANRDPVYVRTDLGNLHGKVDGAFEQILRARKIRPKEPVDVFGWSRGGIAALALAKRCENHKDSAGKPDPIRIRFLGLIDPTAPVKGLVEDKPFIDQAIRKLGSNIENVALFLRDGMHDGNWAQHQWYRTFYKTKSLAFSSDTKVLASKTFPIDHLQTGFSKQIGLAMWEAAKQAGVNLGPVSECPFSAKDYDETPRGGRGFTGNLEKLIREGSKGRYIPAD